LTIFDHTGVPSNADNLVMKAPDFVVAAKFVSMADPIHIVGL
jgi:hypothetical protein